MARLMRIHFASVGYPKARLAPVTIDLRARDATGTGVDTVLWLRNGGGKSSVLNLFYSLFRPARRDFLGASAEGKARRLEDYVKAEDVAFVITEWDVEPASDQALFARPPARTRIVGQVLSWRDRQRSSDPAKLRRCFFTLLSDDRLRLQDLPVEGLGAEPVRSFDAFREWLDGVRLQRPELEAYRDDTARKWAEHLERIGLDPELFRYQLRMNAREGSADEALRFRTTDEFIRYYLGVAFDTEEADQVSANLQGFRDKLARLPALRAEREFLTEVRQHLVEVVSAIEDVASARQLSREQSQVAASIARALVVREREQHDRALGSSTAAEAARKAAKEASNDAARYGRWAGGLSRRALELDVAEAKAKQEAATTMFRKAAEAVAVAEAAVARDARHRVEADRDAKKAALRAAESEQEPLRRQLARAGTTLKRRLLEAANTKLESATRFREAKEKARAQKRECEQQRGQLLTEGGKLAQEMKGIDDWLEEREREREKLRSRALLGFREEASHAVARWKEAAQTARGRAGQLEVVLDEAKGRAERHEATAKEHAAAASELSAAIAEAAPQLESARRERTRLQSLPLLQELEGVELPDIEALGLAARLRGAADEAKKGLLIAAVDGADDERAWQALDRTGRLPPPGDVERVLATLRGAAITAWSGTEYLAENVVEAGRREALVRSDPATRHGIVVPDGDAVEKAAAVLVTSQPRYPVVVSTPSIDEGPQVASRYTLPGHPAHWDATEGAALKSELGERRTRRIRDQDRLTEREQGFRQAETDLARWKARWGEGRLTAAESDQDQRQRTKDQRERAAHTAKRSALEARQQAAAAEDDRSAAEQAANTAELNARDLRGFVDRYEGLVSNKRDRRAEASERLAGIERAQSSLKSELERLDQARLEAHDRESSARRDADALHQERDEVDHDDDLAPAPMDLLQARAAWKALSEQWRQVVSENKLKWELEELETKLQTARTMERRLADGREASVAAIAIGTGSDAMQRAKPILVAKNDDKIAAGHEYNRAETALEQEGLRRRATDDLPSGEPEPLTAAAARERAQECRQAREEANERLQRHRDDAAEHDRTRQAAENEERDCHHLAKRLQDALGEIPRGAPGVLPEGSAATEVLVGERVKALREAEHALDEATEVAEGHAESLRDVALSVRHEHHRSRVKERLKAPAGELLSVATGLHQDVEDRLVVVRREMEDIGQDRRLVLQELDKVAMDGVRLLQAAERTSRLPDGLGAWTGQSFLRIRVDVPGGQSERQGRLEPLLDRLVEEATVPNGRELVHVAVRELSGHRIDATLLKPGAVLRRDRLAVTEMQTFSRGEQLTTAILLYCTMARLRAEQRGHRHRPDAGVLLLDNPVGTCSNVALLDLQREVARQMRVQLVYTTGVNDPNAVATFPNTVRLKNAHQGRQTGDLHVTVEEGVVDAVRVVAKT